MAKGGNMKGHMQSQNNGSRGRAYAVLVLLAFGAAIFGVMILHKLRERRIFNLLVKDKESELNDLKFLLQKEREHTQEAKRKTEEMRSKIHSLRTQKRDLNSRILEMKSTISSLKDEQRIIEVALEEKQDEIKMLREKHMETNPDNSQVKLLSESLRQKEAEVEDLKHRLELPVKVWSVSADDPSNPPINFTTAATVRKEASEGETEELHRSFKRDDQKNSTENIQRTADESALNRNEGTRQGEDRGQAQDGETSADRKSNIGEEDRSTSFQTLDGQREAADSFKAGENFLEEKRYNSGNASVESINHSGQVQKQNNEVGVVDAPNWKEHGTAIGNFADSQGNNYRSGWNDNPKSRDRLRVSQENIRKTKGKSRRIIADSKVTESGGLPEKGSIVSMRNRKFFEEMHGGETNERMEGGKQEKQEHLQDQNMDLNRNNGSAPENQRINDLEETFGNQIRSEQEQKPDTGRQQMQDDSSNLDEAPPHNALLNPEKSAGAKESSQEGRKANTNEKIEKGQEKEVKDAESEMAQSSQEVHAKTAVSEVNRVSKEARNRKPDETAQSQDATGINSKRQEQKQADNLHNYLEHANIAERDVKADDLQFENDQETGQLDQSKGISRETRDQKPNRNAQSEEQNTVVFRDTEHRLASSFHSSSAHARNAERAVKDGNLDPENDKEIEDLDHSKGSAANLEEEEEDNDQADEPEF
nr:protein starmaker-like [Nicotiana tomentosiformis]